MHKTSPDEWRRIEEILDRALDLPAGERTAVVTEACGADERLRERVLSLLAAADTAHDFLERPLEASAGDLLEEIADGVDEAGSPSEVSESVEGDRVGPYRLITELGRGGMGAVYLAERDDQAYRRRVAVKVVPPGPLGRSLRGRFLLEQRILASLEHPHIARLYDAGVDDAGVPYIVMEYVEGRPIDVYCDDEKLSVRARLRLFDQVCDALEFAHGKLVVHRDLKPGNVLVSTDGSVKLLDFGIAKLLRTEEDGGRGVTALGPLRALTPEYASPEQLRGEPVSTATDVYALGVLLYELLTGFWPYGSRAGPARSVEQAVLERDAERPSSAVTRPSMLREGSEAEAVAVSDRRSTSPAALRRQLRGDLDNIVLTALRKEPEQRYPSVSHLRDDLRRYVESRPVSARPATFGYRARRFVGRHRVGVVAGAALAASLVAGLASTAWQAREASREARRADAVRDFVVGLFQVSDPDRAGGDTITARALLDQGVEQLGTGLDTEPRTRAEMLSVLGTIYEKLGLYAQARPLLEEAVTLREAIHGPGHLDVARSMSELSSLLFELGDYERGEELARAALTVRRDLLGPEDTLVAASLTDMAAHANRRGRLEEAESLYREGLAIDRKHGATGAVATDLDNLSVALWRSGRYDEALPLAEEALALRRELHGDEHTDVATSLFNSATILMASGDYEQAEARFRETLALRRSLLGNEHAHVALTLSNLAEVLQKQGRLDEAVATSHESLAIRRAVFGDRSIQVGSSLNHLGVVRYFQGEEGEAADLFEQVLRIWTAVLGEDHPDVLTVLNNLGAARRAHGDLEGAEQALRQALALRRRTLGEEHPDVGQSLNNLAELLVRKGDLAQAEPTFREALENWRRTLGTEHPTVAFALMGLGRLLSMQDRCQEAEPLFHEALELRLANLDEGSPDVAWARFELGRCYLARASFEEAEPLLLASHTAWEKQRGPDDDATADARAALARLYTAWGRPSDALRYQR